MIDTWYTMYYYSRSVVGDMLYMTYYSMQKLFNNYIKKINCLCAYKNGVEMNKQMIMVLKHISYCYISLI